MPFVDTDQLLKQVREHQPLNCSELTKLLGFEVNKKNIIIVYNKIKRLAMDGVVKSKRVGGSRVVWLDRC